jgi:hypothetical protein
MLTGQGLWPNASADGLVRSLDADGSGRVLVGGDFAVVNGAAMKRLASVDAGGGAPEAGFGETPNVGLAKVWALSVSGARLLLGGEFTAWSGVGVSNAAKMTLPAYIPPTPSPTFTASPTPMPNSARGPGASPRWVQPNPWSGADATLHVDLLQPAHAQWRLLTARGALAAEGASDLPVGVSSLPVPWARPPAGLYFLLMTLHYADGRSETWPPYKLLVLP